MTETAKPETRDMMDIFADNMADLKEKGMWNSKQYDINLCAWVILNTAKQDYGERCHIKQWGGGVNTPPQYDKEWLTEWISTREVVVSVGNKELILTNCKSDGVAILEKKDLDKALSNAVISGKCVNMTKSATISIPVRQIQYAYIPSYCPSMEDYVREKVKPFIIIHDKEDKDE